MGQRSNVDNLANFDSGTMDSTDCSLTAVSGAFYIRLYLTETKIECYFCTIFCSHLSSIRSVFLRAAEAHFACRRPRYNLAFAVGQRNYYVIERAMNMKLPHSIYLNSFLLYCNCFLRHILFII